MTRITYEIVEHDGDGPIRWVTCSPNRSRRMTRPAEQRSARRTNRSSPASRRTFHTRTRMAAGTKNGRQVPTGRRRMSKAEGGADRLSDQSARISSR
jgi:hypothetical protein